MTDKVEILLEIYKEEIAKVLAKVIKGTLDEVDCTVELIELKHKYAEKIINLVKEQNEN